MIAVTNKVIIPIKTMEIVTAKNTFVIFRHAFVVLVKSGSSGSVESWSFESSLSNFGSNGFEMSGIDSKNLIIAIRVCTINPRISQIIRNMAGKVVVVLAISLKNPIGVAVPFLTFFIVELLVEYYAGVITGISNGGRSKAEGIG